MTTQDDSLWIDKIGVEIEIGVDQDAPLEQRKVPLFRETGDGSLRSEEPHTDLVEYVSDPVDYPTGIQDLKGSVRQIYSNAVDINYSMGLHIHVSLNRPQHRLRLASTEFEKFFIEYLVDSKLWDAQPPRGSDIWRLKRRVLDDREHPAYNGQGYAHYCQPIGDSYIIDRQLNGGGEKYRRIRFHSYDTPTVEFRLFPAMETAENVFKAIDVVTKAINKYLREGRYMDGHQAELQEPEEITFEEIGSVNAQDSTTEQSSSLTEEVTHNV